MIREGVRCPFHSHTDDEAIFHARARQLSNNPRSQRLLDAVRNLRATRETEGNASDDVV
jgi:hypothetical protein